MDSILFKVDNMQFSKKLPSILNISFYFLVAVLVACPSFYSAPKTYCSFENPDRIDFSKYWSAEVPTPKLFVGIQSHLPYIINFAYLLVVQLSSYSLSIILARKTLSELKGKSLSPKTKALQEQFSK